MESAQQLKKIDSGYYLIVISDLGWFISFCVICRTQTRRSTKTSHGNPHDYQQKKEKKMKTFLQAFTTNFS